MSSQIIELSNIEPAKLDGFLSLGWFRMQQTIFTTDVLYFDGQIFDAVWLRLRIQDFVRDKKYKILTRKNKMFRTEIKKEKITPEHEALYNSYKQSIPFEGATSLHSLLYGDSVTNVYNTWMIDVYDDDTLIGTGCFDLGNKAAAGICSIYDPAYKKYSLGKFMIYEKIQFCKKKEIIFFYPGYFVPGYPLFDYKLEIGKPVIEYFKPGIRKWFSYYENAYKFLK
ncbi:MAG TPA: hypothetical protein VMU83_01925 [Hanamia sp.]|nr:hypothetical protein [Hanamia sp.]